MVGLFLGAGFSKWSADLPLVNELFDFEISEIRSRDDVWIDRLEAEKKSWDANNHGHLNDEAFIAYILQSKLEKLKGYLSTYIARRLSEPFLMRILGGSVHTLTINDKSLVKNAHVQKARRFIDYFRFEGIRGIITTNYDLLIEYSLS